MMPKTLNLGAIVDPFGAAPSEKSHATIRSEKNA
jgi:hypothetical protein